MHVKRWLTALIGIPLLILVFGPAPQWVLALVLAAVSIVALSEFYRITAPDVSPLVLGSCYLLTLALFVLISWRQFMLVPVIINLFALIVLICYLFSRAAPSRVWTADIGKVILGPVYIVIPLSLIMFIDLNPHGQPWLFFLLAINFATDTGALYSGKLFGRHKFYKKISPNKTWEGAIGGLLISFFVGLVFLRVWPFQPLNFKIVGLIILISVSAQIGDLVESMIKRNHGADDSGFLLPGHGGVLDRIDGLLFSIPVLYIYTLWVL